MHVGASGPVTTSSVSTPAGGSGCWRCTRRCAQGNRQPGRTVSSVVTLPKTRELHAPDFADRDVQNLLEVRLEPLFEPGFIHDSFANRRGKGSYAAVDRPRAFMRTRQNMAPIGDGWFLQIDIHTCFNSIHRPTLYGLLCARLALAERGRQLLSFHARALRSLCHRPLRRRADELLRDPLDAARVAAHKRLCHAAPYCGLPVGKLTSQFSANVCLDPLDQFVKHTLKVRHYVRYPDDFALLEESRELLLRRHTGIEAFLRERPRLALKRSAEPRPCAAGIDFLGYVVHAHRRRVRPHVVHHCQYKLQAWHGRHGTALRNDARAPQACTPCWAATGVTQHMPTACACAASFSGANPRSRACSIWPKTAVSRSRRRRAGRCGRF